MMFWKKVKLCCDCKWHRSASFGPQYDRCQNPTMIGEDDGFSPSGLEFLNIVRGNEPRCHQLRQSGRRCGKYASGFEAKMDAPK